jgi:RNA polymerase sigma-70 factor (ECF subfamily)
MANGQPAFAAYEFGADGAYHAHHVMALTVTPTGVGQIVAFLDPRLVEMFGLPLEYTAVAVGPAGPHDTTVTAWRR